MKTTILRAQYPNLQECEMCHSEYSVFDVEITISGQILCKKCCKTPAKIFKASSADTLFQSAVKWFSITK